ncbi:MAG: putative toxin-antitoxin system toxin component, PIN family [Candidatus Obscuribacterales bacterium]
MPIRAVVDTNIWVSALLTPGKARQLLHYAIAERFELYSSVELLAEMIRTLNRPKITALVDEEDIDELISVIQDTSIVVDIRSIQPISRDPNDDVFLACALAARAEYLVSGDKDLLCLKEHGKTKIVSPAEFLAILESTLPEPQS